MMKWTPQMDNVKYHERHTWVWTGKSGCVWLVVAVFGTVSVAVDSTLGFDELLMIEVMIG